MPCVAEIVDWSVAFPEQGHGPQTQQLMGQIVSGFYGENAAPTAAFPAPGQHLALTPVRDLAAHYIKQRRQEIHLACRWGPPAPTAQAGK
jgi:hypothetical protein